MNNASTFPDVSGALLDWFSPMVFETTVKTVVNFQVVETPTTYNCQGIIMPFTPQQLQIKPEGQWSWKWFTLFSDTTLVLVNDQVVNYLGKQYRVMATNDFSANGYMQYELVIDYTGSGPGAY